jgi:hypothetical protein
MTSSTRIWFIGAPLICALVPLVCIPAAEWMADAPHGSDDMSFFMMFFFVVPALLVAVSAMIVALVGMMFCRIRRPASIVGLCSVACLAALFTSFFISGKIRMGAFYRVAESSKPLIAAIRAYEQKNGRPPESLQSLVPEFIPSIPSTGMASCARYRYIIPGTNINNNPWINGNPWVLVVWPSHHAPYTDQLIYLPLTNYPVSGYGYGQQERVGDWAWVGHE